jgi:hypothetical protein
MSKRKTAKKGVDAVFKEAINIIGDQERRGVPKEIAVMARLDAAAISLVAESIFDRAKLDDSVKAAGAFLERRAKRAFEAVEAVETSKEPKRPGNESN